ncbi:hypothetical protein DRQ50_14925, partial [bacterium]
ITAVNVGPDQPLVVEFSGTPKNATAPLRISIESTDHTLRRSFTLGGAEMEKHLGVVRLKQVDFPVPEFWPNSWAQSLPAKPVPLASAELPVRDKDSAGYNIRVHGRFVYVRDGTTVLGADGLTVHVYDDDPVFDDYLGYGGTDPYGQFDFTVYWDPQLGDDDPDLKLEFHTENSEVLVKVWFMLTPYRFAVGPWNNFTGDDLDVGIVSPSDEADNRIPHVLTTNTRIWRYVHSLGHDTRFVKVHWPGPAEDGAFYNRVTETIQLAGDNSWESGTQAHEFGHHIMNCLSSLPEIDYCNDTCDPDPPSDCGHCVWCEEDEAIAWSEGFADYTGHAIPRTFDASYGTPCLNEYNMSRLRVCWIDSLWDEALDTEGFTAAALADIDDNSWDDDAHTPGFDDRIALGGQVILDVLHDDHAMTTMAFLRDLMARFPDQTEDLWWTAMNSGLNLDAAPPDQVFPIVCTTGQAPDVPSPNPNLGFYWPRPDDDASGVRGYSYILSADAPFRPYETMSLDGDSLVMLTGLAPATYYFNVLSVDWDGNWSVDYTTSGPYIITEPQPRNLTFEAPTGWDFYVIPRNTPDVTINDCPMPPTLDGMQPTYWNLAGRNEGDLGTGAHLYTALDLDGVELDRFNWGDTPGWSPFMVMNDGPETVLGGLHTFTGRLDPDDLISETDENDNAIGKQFAWRPPTATPEIVYYSAFAIPDPTGGWDSVSDMFKFYNCRGLNFTSSGWWNAMVLWANNPATDYDLRLHEMNENAMGGYLLTEESSNQPAGWADAVLVNRNQLGSLSWDASIVNLSGHSGSLHYQHVISQQVAYGDSLTEIMGDQQYVLLREFEVEFLEEGFLSLDL